MKFLQRYAIFKNKKNLQALFTGLFFLLIGIVATYFAILYANVHVSYPVTDIILSNIRTYDVDEIFVYGPVIFWAIVLIYMLYFAPEKLPFSFKSIALFLLIRSAFVCMTHIAPFPTHDLVAGKGFLGVFTTGDDLFFSSHTGLPFLMAFLLWDNKLMRYFCILGSLFFGAIVLMAHLHYSIDVFAAFFITYTIYHIALKFFKKDKLLADSFSLHPTP
jgi:hypothetical protein